MDEQKKKETWLIFICCDSCNVLVNWKCWWFNVIYSSVTLCQGFLRQSSFTHSYLQINKLHGKNKTKQTKCPVLLTPELLIAGVQSLYVEGVVSNEASLLVYRQLLPKNLNHLVLMAQHWQVGARCWFWKKKKITKERMGHVHDKHHVNIRIIKPYSVLWSRPR